MTCGAFLTWGEAFPVGRGAFPSACAALGDGNARRVAAWLSRAVHPEGVRTGHGSGHQPQSRAIR